MSFTVKYDEKGNVISAPPFPDDYVEPTEPVYETEQEADPAFFNQTQPQEAAPEPTAQNGSPVASAAPKTSEQSWAELREAKRAAERERDEYRRMLEERTRPQQPEEDLSYTINDDDLVEGKLLAKVDKKIKRLELELAQQRAQNNQIAVEQKLKQKYSDFDEVVSKENIDRLQQEYPEILHTLRSGSDLYSQGISAYTMIKKLGIVPDDDTASTLARLKSNSSKPRASNTVQSQRGDSPLTRANPFAHAFTAGDLSEDMKAQQYEEMNKAIRNKF